MGTDILPTPVPTPEPTVTVAAALPVGLMPGSLEGILAVDDLGR